jgi:hypothetical protein
MLDGHPHVERAGMLSFDVVVPLPAGTIGGRRLNPPEVVEDPDLLVHEVSDRWAIHWIGVETG